MSEHEEFLGAEQGFLLGKAHDIAEWSFRKEQREFEKLAKRLWERGRKRRQRERNPEPMREATRRWRRRNPEKVEDGRRRRRRWRPGERKPQLDERRHSGVCELCGKPWRWDRPRRYCSDGCRRKAERWRKRGIPKGTKHPNLRKAICRLLNTDPWLSARKVAEIGGWKQGSVATTLSALEKDGVVLTNGAKRGRLYALKAHRTR